MNWLNYVLILSFVCSVWRLESKPLVIDDLQIRQGIDGGLRDLQADDKLLPLALLQAQMQEREGKRVSISSTQVKRVSGNHQSTYSEAAGSVFVLGSIYLCGKCDDWHYGGAASAWALTTNGIMVTNYHVFEKNDEERLFGVTGLCGKVYPVVEILSCDRDRDIAIFRVDADGFQPLKLRSDAPVGTKVQIISHPNSNFYLHTQGAIARYFQMKHGKRDRGTWMMVTAEYAKGSSGAPVFDEFGAVVGMVSSTKSIYYKTDKEKGQQNLQMVLRNCTLTSSIMDLLEIRE